MNIQLMQGQFNAKDAIDIITQMVDIKVKYQESKISKECNEEDIKMREAKIRQLQKERFEANKSLTAKSQIVNIETVIKMDKI